MTDPIADLTPQLEAKVAGFVKEHRLPGAAAGVVSGDGLAWSFGYGFADIEARRGADARTLYRIASITKTFTATSVLQLRDEGKLHLDDPIVEHIPELVSATNPYGHIKHVTIRRLLSHESGLQSEPPGTDWGEGRYEGLVDRNLAMAAEIGVKVAANTQAKYSNLGFQMLGEVVARVSGIPYADYVRSNILEPLDMTSTSFEPLPEELRDRLATGYDYRWLSDELAPARDNPVVWAEGGLVSSVEDLAKWLSFQLREDAGERKGAQVIAGETLKEMHRPRYISDEAWTEAFGLSWYAVRRGDTVWIQHSGGLYGFHTSVCFRDSDRVGAIALLNGGAEAASLAMDLGDLVLPAARTTVKRAELWSPMPASYGSLLGLYQLREWDAIVRIEWRDGKLTAVDPSEPMWRPTLSATDEPDVFVIDPNVRESGELAVFLRRADGRVRAVQLGPVTCQRLDTVEG